MLRAKPGPAAWQATRLSLVDRITIRDAHQREDQRLGDLIVSSFLEFEPHFPAPVWRAAVSDWRDVAGRRAVSAPLVAMVEAEIVGTATLFPDAMHSRAERWPEGWAAIRAVAVAPAWRGLGIGRRLIQACLDRAVGARRTAVGLHTAGFMVAAAAMYEAAGFRRDPTFDLVWHVDGIAPAGTPGSIDAIAYRRDLDEAAPGEDGRHA